MSLIVAKANFYRKSYLQKVENIMMQITEETLSICKLILFFFYYKEDDFFKDNELFKFNDLSFRNGQIFTYIDSSYRTFLKENFQHMKGPNFIEYVMLLAEMGFYRKTILRPPNEIFKDPYYQMYMTNFYSTKKINGDV